MFSAFEVGRKRCDGQPIHFEYWSRISILPTENSTTWVCSLPHYLPVEQSDSSSALKHSDEELLWSKFCESWNLASKYSKCNSCFTREAIHIKGRVLQINLLRRCINWVRFAKIYFAKIHILGNFRHAKYSKWSCLPWTCYSLMGLFIGLSPRWTPLYLLFCSSPYIWLWKLIQNKHVWDGCSTVWCYEWTDGMVNRAEVSIVHQVLICPISPKSISFWCLFLAPQYLNWCFTSHSLFCPF